MSTSKRIVKNLFSLTFAEFATKGIQAIFFAFLARALGDEGLGIYGYATAFTTWFIVFVGMGLDTIGTRSIGKDKGNLLKYVNSIVTIRTGLSIIAFSLLAIIIYFINKPFEVKIVLLISGLNIFSNALLLNWVYLGLEKMHIVALRQFLLSLLNLSGLIVFVHSPEDLVPAVIIITASTAINSIWMLILYMKSHGLIKPFYEKELWTKLYRASLPLGLSFLLVSLYNNLDTVMLGMIRSDAETGFYTSSYKIIVLSILPTQIIQNAFFPNLSRLVTAEDRIKMMLKYTMLIYLTGTFINSYIFMFSGELVGIYLGPGFEPTADLLQIRVFSGMLMYVNITFSATLIAWNKEKALLYATIAGGLVNTILNFIVIPTYGMYGAAITTVLSEFAVFIVLVYLYRKISTRTYLEIMLKFMLFSIPSCYLGKLALDNGVNIIISMIIPFVVYLILNFVFKTIKVNEIMGFFKK